MEGLAHNELEGGFRGKIEKIKQEDDVSAINDKWLRNWSDAADVKLGLSTAKVEEDEIKGSDYRENEYEQLGQSTQEGTEMTVQPTNVTASQRIAGNDIDKLVEALCQDAKVSQTVGNMCKFKCPICDKTIYSWQILGNHVRTKSDCAKKLSFADVANVISKANCHSCKICSAKVLCDIVFIRRHMRNKHQMLLKEYIEKFNLDYLKAVSYDHLSENLIGNLCVRKCNDCGLQFSCLSSLLRHQKALSHKNVTCNQDNFVKKVFHKCKICNKTIICEMSSIYSHVKKSHKLSLKEYCKDYGVTIAKSTKATLIESMKVSPFVDDLCTFACADCGELFNSSHRLFGHRRQTRHITKKDKFATEPVKGFSYQCKFCTKLLLCDRNIIFNHMKTSHKTKLSNIGQTASKRQYIELCKTFKKSLPVSLTVHDHLTVSITKIPLGEITSAIGNLSSFSCPKCGKQKFFEWRSLKSHFKTVHLKQIMYSPDFVHTARYHACLLCPKGVLSDRGVLTSHLKAMHKMHLSKYEKIFLRNGGRTLPTYRNWFKEKFWKANHGHQMK